MSSPNNDFAPANFKVAGCFLALLMLPLLACVHAWGTHPVSTYTFACGAVITLAGLGALCGRPNMIVEALRTIRAFGGSLEPTAKRASKILATPGTKEEHASNPPQLEDNGRRAA